MVTRNFKSVWSLTGSIDGSFVGSVNKAEKALARLRKEQKADVAEATRLNAVLKQSTKGTATYANAQRRLADLKSTITGREEEIAKLAMTSQRGAEEIGGLGSAVSGLRSAAVTARGPLLAFGAGVGILTGFAVALHKGLLESANEAERLQTIGILGFNTNEYQRLSRAVETYTGNAEGARAATQSLIDVGTQLRRGLAYDPSQVTGQLTALARLGIRGKDFAQQDIGQQFDTIAHAIRDLDNDYAAAALSAAGYGEQFISVALEHAEALRKGDSVYATFLAKRAQDIKLTEEAQRKAKEYNQIMLELGNELDEIKYKAVALGGGPAVGALRGVGGVIGAIADDPTSLFHSQGQQDLIRAFARDSGILGGGGGREAQAPVGIMGGGATPAQLGQLPARDFWSGARGGNNVGQMTNFFTIDGSSSPQETGEAVVFALNEKLGQGRGGY